ncbi:hypothetical protein [Bifidobacterium dentium]|uniref:hypothetical protein n=1 Tax=Bifidobacterium dentium TaxID=1689 RepID=UPI0018B04355|nr:hypothetical protein [Bifidobacterium dentium]MBF9690458.1 hypothetical protein [Bifidobacterium dentium]
MIGFTIPRAFASLDPWSGTLLVGIPKGVVLADGRDVGGWSLGKSADDGERDDWAGYGDVRVTLDERRPVRLMRGIGDDVETMVADAADLARAVGSHLDAMLRPVIDMDWEPDFGFDVEDSARLDRCPECFDPDRIDRRGGRHAYYATADGGRLRLTERSWFDPNLGDFEEACADYVSAAGMMASVRDTACVGASEPPARLDMKVSDLVAMAGGCGSGLDPTDVSDPTSVAGAAVGGGLTP